jgi:hypothetical protein
MTVICRFNVGFMSVYESKIKKYNTENKAFMKKDMSDVSKNMFFD